MDEAFPQRACHILINQLATGIQQVMVIDTGGAGGFAGAAGQAAVKVQLCRSCRGAALQYLFDQVDPAPWAIKLVTCELVGWTGGIAEAAVDTVAQDLVGLLSGRGFQQGG